MTQTAEYEPLLRWFGDHELCDELSWRTYHSDGQLHFVVPCNDMFWWATADAEEVTSADVPELQRAWDDLVCDDCYEVWAPQLWIARKRGMRPQRPWWDRERIPDAVKELFCAAGPERDRKDEG